MVQPLRKTKLETNPHYLAPILFFLLGFFLSQILFSVEYGMTKPNDEISLLTIQAT